MPFNQPTPESMLGRADSKNPASTCRGITSNGKSCRRAIAKNSVNELERGVVAVVSNDSGRLSDAAFYCWQHKDQAGKFVQASNAAHGQGHTTVLPIQERTSIDSLVARLGVASLSEHTRFNGLAHVDQGKQLRPNRTYQSFDRTEPPRPQYQRPVRPAYAPQPQPRTMPSPSQQRRRKNPGLWASVCCMVDHSDDGDHYEIVRHRQRTEATPRPEMSYAGPPRTAPNPPIPAWDQHPMQAPARTYQTSTKKPLPSQRHALSELPIRPSNLQPSSSHTQTLLSYIPPSLSPLKTSTLLTELSKPISANDEAGYIYIFWLTPDSSTAPKETASRLLSPAIHRSRHRVSDVVSDYSSRSSPSKPKTIMLKIGRANNVHRRMTEWTRQCGYDLNLVRWYPYVSSSPASSPVRSQHQSQAMHAPGVRKVPHAHRVERLVHLELAEQRVKQLCGACGKEHREWFEVEASEEGVRGVDEVVKRWVRWAEEREGDVENS